MSAFFNEGYKATAGEQWARASVRLVRPREYVDGSATELLGVPALTLIGN